MIKFDPESKLRLLFYLIFIIIILSFILTVTGWGRITKYGIHPIIELVTNIDSPEAMVIVKTYLILTVRQWILTGGFILGTFLIFTLLSKFDVNLKMIRWIKTKDMGRKEASWMEVASSAFLVTILSLMTATVLISFVLIWLHSG